MVFRKIILTIKDISIITGTTKQNSYNIMVHLKDVLKKEKHQKVTIKEYCEYYGINLLEVYKSLDIK